MRINFNNQLFYLKCHRLLLLIFSFVLPVVLTSCGGSGRKSYKIGVSQCTDDDWRAKMNDEMRREVLFHDNIDIEILSADGSNDTQIRDIRRLIQEGVDLLIVSPNEAEALEPVITEAYSGGIPVITVDRDVEGDAYTAHIEVDNEALGREAAKYALARTASSGVPLRAVELQGNMEMTPAVKRHSGFAGFLREAAPGSLVASVDCDWDGTMAFKALDSLLKSNPDINFVFAHNDNMALKVATALDDSIRKGITFIGIDGIPKEGIKGVADGDINATLLYPTEGGFLIKTAMRILQGEPTEKNRLLAPLAPIEKEDAEMLLQQDKLLQDETREILMLRDKLTEYLDLYSMQRVWIFTMVAIVVLLFGFLFFMMGRTWKKIRNDRFIRLEEEAQESDSKKETGDIDSSRHSAIHNTHLEQSEFYRRFIEIVKSNIHNPNLNIDDIASSIGLSKSQLGRRIKSLTNLTPVEIIRHERLKIAKVILTSSQDKSISEVAYEVGFSLPSYFSKCYRDFYGESPSEVRKKIFG